MSNQIRKLTELQAQLACANAIIRRQRIQIQQLQQEIKDRTRTPSFVP